MIPVPGQRWTSETEPELGLGTIIGVEGRTVTVLFLAAAERRTYAMANMPLSRVHFDNGDRIEHHEGWFLTVSQVNERDGLLIYQGTKDDGGTAHLPEMELSNYIQFNRPLERLFAGQSDDNRWFELRYQTLQHINRLEPSPVWGLSGGRTSLLPHQLYIAHEAAHRHTPRLLLADEVGLGKTIEACMILHHQLLTGRARRVLILVPETLINQWLVELLRRFNLRFSIFNEDRCRATEKSGQGTNPFHSEQLVLCSLGLFTQHTKRQEQLLDGDWDLLVVDEAHHLEWSQAHASPEYQIVDQLAARIPGVLLLTATPEQLGGSGHFARLRLLDPDRFHDLKAFHQEEALYAPVAEAADRLINNNPLSPDTIELLSTKLGEEDAAPLLSILSNPTAPNSAQQEANTQLIEMLLDRHGTGRVMFRNTRARIKGFPARQLHSALLPLPEAYQKFLEALATKHAEHDEDTLLLAQALLLPEAVYRARSQDEDTPWWRFDPRVDWLIKRIRELRGYKILLICSQEETAIELEQALRVREGIQSALFHEGMSILERDRAAAWFADMEEGVPLLICSEIGSEGRNFQFAHHLVLFDLPFDPDLLEQRIGRLDRIGQQETVCIHTPCLEGTGQEVLLRWFHEGLDAFETTCPAGHTVFSRQREWLYELICQQSQGNNPQQTDELIEAGRTHYLEVSQELQKGRDHLLELNSCRPRQAEQLCKAIRELDQDPALPAYLEQLFDCCGVEMETHSADSYILRPSDRMQCESFPGLPADGLTCTFNRDRALSHEGQQFLTWEHPLVSDAMAMVLDGGMGNCSIVAARHPAIAPGTLLTEALFLLECPAPKRLRVGRFQPPTPLRILLDEKQQEVGNNLSPHEISSAILAHDQASARQFILKQRRSIKATLSHGETLAAGQVPLIFKKAQQQALASYTGELRRLAALRRVNPSIREEELEGLKQELRDLHQHLQSSHLRLDAVRLIIGC
jgi:ATP-dependent helicase HepA